jgi:hypothetical protein
MLEINLKNSICGIIFILFSAAFALGQTIKPPVDLETILKNADAQTQNYRSEFKNLLSEEIKTFETFDKNGSSKKRTIVESNFIIYQSSKDESVSTEYRNVFKVDGKPVGDSEKRTTELFEKIAKAESVQQELERIKKESSRYDKTLELDGLSLLQSPILAEYSRPYFDFKLLGREISNGTDAFLVEYRQTKPSPYILIEEETTDRSKLTLGFSLDLPDTLNKSNVFLRGKLWIDAQTFQIRREERELTAQIESSTKPLVLFRSEFEYQPSDFGILVPKKIAFTYFEVKSKDKGREISAKLDTKATFEYAKFSKSDVEVESNKVNSPKSQ